MPEWAVWALGVAVAILYFRSWVAQKTTKDRVEVQSEVDRLHHEIREVWTRCGYLEGYVDSMAKRIIENDPLPDHYDSVTEAAKRWQAWRSEQLERSKA